MALDREKSFKEAERLLKAGRAEQAVAELRKLADDSPRDVLGLNRSGDLLVKSGRGAHAIPFYERVVDQFSQSGFFPKAVAILKKILKLDPERPEAMLKLGDLYLRQKLPGEARTWLLHAADRFLKAQR